MDEQQQSLDQELKTRFNELHPVVQQAIKSAELEQHLREVSQRYRLHLNQWQVLENEVMMALLGVTSVDELAENIQQEVEIDGDLAQQIADDIFERVFRPIRSAMEQSLQQDGTAAVPTEREPVQTIGSAKETALPEDPAPEQPASTGSDEAKKSRPSSTEYEPGKTSTTRRNIEDDPYREPVE